MELVTAACQVKSKTHAAVESEFGEHPMAEAVNRVDRRVMK